jgi:hypothetical protein
MIQNAPPTAPTFPLFQARQLFLSDPAAFAERVHGSEIPSCRSAGVRTLAMLKQCLLLADEARECANNSLLDSQHQWDHGI